MIDFSLLSLIGVNGDTYGRNRLLKMRCIDKYAGMFVLFLVYVLIQLMATYFPAIDAFNYLKGIFCYFLTSQV